MNKCFSIFSKDKQQHRSSPEASSSSNPKSKVKKPRNKSAPELRNRGDFASSEATTSGGGGGGVKLTSIAELYREKEQSLRVFSYSELREATTNFNRLLKIGEGGFGSVYKGSLRLTSSQEPTIVAIKKLNTHGLQGHKQWVAEVQFLGVLQHPNLVKLLGYCSVNGERGTQLLLVYEYMPNKSLEDHLFDRTKPVIPWIKRLKIILGAAQGMAYLHEGLKVAQDLQVIYRDFKTSNILLDKEFHPKLSDFGLAREGPNGELTHVSTAPVGTQGYAAPEYIERGHLTVKSDVWSFGVVLYEILTGRRTLDRNLPTGEQRLLEWVRDFPADGRRFTMIMDRRLQNNYSMSAAKRVAKLADWCLRKDSKDRPSMSQVADVLALAIGESESEAEENRGLVSGQAAQIPYGRAK